MWTFIPLLPTEEAWRNRTFKATTHAFEIVLDELKARKDLRGQLILNLISKQDILKNYVYSIYESHIYIDFNSYTELETIFNSLKKANLTSNIHKLYLYNLGYFVN
jgi:hypothetical protein